MGLINLPLILGISMGYYLWHWNKDSRNIGFYIYSVFYFNSRMHVQHANSVDAPAFYDMYHEVFKGKANYADYLRAIEAHYDDSLLKLKKETRSVVLILLRYNGILILIGATIIALLAWSLNALFLFLLGVLLYFIARFIKFLIQEDVREFLYTNLIVMEAIKTYNKSKKKSSPRLNR